MPLVTQSLFSALMNASEAVIKAQTAALVTRLGLKSDASAEDKLVPKDLSLFASQRCVILLISIGAGGGDGGAVPR